MPPLAPRAAVFTRSGPRRITVWAPVSFAHLRAHRCAVHVAPGRDSNEALCPRTPIYRAEIERAPHRVVFALCAAHGAEARAWGTVTRLATFRELDETTEG